MAWWVTTTLRRSRNAARFDAAYKLGIIAEYERLTEPGDKAALLRREGLYFSHIVEWGRAGRCRAFVPVSSPGERVDSSAIVCPHADHGRARAEAVAFRDPARRGPR